MNRIGIAGSKGEKVRSDCYFQLELARSGGLDIELKSKVEAPYGKDIRNCCKELLSFYKIRNAKLQIEDSGALPFVLLARLEAAVKQVINTGDEFLPQIHEENLYESVKDNIRYSRLYLPGNSPVYMINAGIHKPHGIILDLEDSVPFDKKHEARILVRNALRQVNFFGAERMVRINQVPEGLEDLKFVIPHNVHVILIPKCECPDQILQLQDEIEKIRTLNELKNKVFLIPIIETAMGIEMSYEIATSSINIAGLAIGLEDYTADLGVSRTPEGIESLYARTRLINACKAAEVQVYDSVYSDVEDTEGLYKYALRSRSLGFEGMGCIHPRQIPLINKAFTPQPEEIEKAKKVILEFAKVEQQGVGVFSSGSQMIDKPVVKRAEKIIQTSINLGLLSREWRSEYESN